MNTLRVLVAADHPDLLAPAVRLLEAEGYSVKYAADGAAALQMARTFRPKLMLIDQGLPGVDGFRVCRHVKADPTLSDCLVVIVANAPFLVDRRPDELEAGADGYLALPITDEMLARLTAFTRTSRLATDLRHKNEELLAADASAAEALRATLNLAEDAFEARDRADTLYRDLQDEISERLRVQGKNTEADRHARAVIETSLDGYWRLDPQGHLVDVNDAYCRLSGYSREELLAMSVSDLSSIHSAADITARLQAIVAAGGSRFEARHRRKDGGTFDLEVSATVLPAEGTGFVVFLRDISERKLVEEALSESEMRLAGIVNSAMDAIISVDERGTIVIFNPAAEAMFRLSRAKAVGSQLERLIPAMTRAGNHQYLAEFVRTSSLAKPTALPSPITGLRADGEEFHMETTVSHVEIAGRRYFTAVVRDLTDVETRDKQLTVVADQLRHSQKMDAFGELAGGIAHDFNNILAVISMQVELSEMEEGLSTEIREGLEQIRFASDRAARLTNQLLLFSRRRTTLLQVVDLNLIVEGVNRMLQRIIHANVDVTLRLHPRPLQVYADSGMIEQVIMNLVINARDAMPLGGSITIETEPVVDPDETDVAVLRVTDTGNGIAPNEVDRIFEPFFTTKEIGKGTGLGLSVALGIIQEHHGTITVVSTLGEGTTMEIRLPAEDRSVTVDSVGSGDQSDNAALTGTETILLVEDDTALRYTTRRSLERQGYHVVEAATGTEALAVWEEHADHIQLVLTDVVMPGLVDGYELAARLRQRRPGLRVIIASGYNSNPSGLIMEPSAGQAFLLKPYRQRQLHQLIRESLDM